MHLIEKRKNEKNFDIESHHRPLAEKIMERNSEKNRIEKSQSNHDFSISGTSPIRYSKRFENGQNSNIESINNNNNNNNYYIESLNNNNNNNNSYDDSEKGDYVVENCSSNNHNNNNNNTIGQATFDFIDSVEDTEGDEARGERNDNKIIQKPIKISRSGAGLATSAISNPLNGNNTVNKIGDLNLSALTPSYIMRTASAPCDVSPEQPRDPENKTKNEKINGILASNSGRKKGGKDENEANETFLRSVEAIKRAEGGSFIGVPLVGKQTRNALKERLLI